MVTCCRLHRIVTMTETVTPTVTDRDGPPAGPGRGAASPSAGADSKLKCHWLGGPAPAGWPGSRDLSWRPGEQWHWTYNFIIEDWWRRFAEPPRLVRASALGPDSDSDRDHWPGRRAAAPRHSVTVAVTAHPPAGSDMHSWSASLPSLLKWPSDPYYYVTWIIPDYRAEVTSSV